MKNKKICKTLSKDFMDSTYNHGSLVPVNNSVPSKKVFLNNDIFSLLLWGGQSFCLF